MPNMFNLQYTNDKTIRTALKEILRNNHKGESKTIIIDELGLTHGATRIDVAVINGLFHGYELKSDLDTLLRLPEQMKIYNSIFDKITLVVGKNHVFEAIKLVPEWWGIVIAKVVRSNGSITFCNIRESSDNPLKDSNAIAKLLWKEEALEILKCLNQADGMSSKPASVIYDRLVTVLDQNTLRKKVRHYLSIRLAWRSQKPHMQYDG